MIHYNTAFAEAIKNDREPWHIYDEPIKKIDLSETIRESMKVECGVCRNGDCMLLRWLVVDLKTGEEYRESFNCDWIDEEHRVWLAAIIARLLVDTVREAQGNQQRRAKAAFTRWAEIMGVAVK